MDLSRLVDGTKIITSYQELKKNSSPLTHDHTTIYFKLSDGDVLDQSERFTIDQRPDRKFTHLTTEDRKKIAKRFHDYFGLDKFIQGEQNDVILRSTFDDTAFTYARIGTKSSEGEVYEICAEPVTNNTKFAMKMVPLITREGDKPEESRQFLERDILSELSKAVVEGFCPNLPFLYGSAYAAETKYQSTKFSNRILSRLKHARSIDAKYPSKNDKIPSLLIFCELMASDVVNVFNMENGSIPNFAFVSYFLFQVIAGLHCMQKIFQIDHNDLHLGNVLISNFEPDPFQYRLYKMKRDNGTTVEFYLPQNGTLAVVSDFGRASEAKPYKGVTSDLYAFVSRVSHSYKFIRHPFVQFASEIMGSLKQNMSYVSILETYFPECMVDPRKTIFVKGIDIKIVQEFDMTRDDLLGGAYKIKIRDITPTAWDKAE